MGRRREKEKRKSISTNGEIEREGNRKFSAAFGAKAPGSGARSKQSSATARCQPVDFSH
jgi:hypothetical protein